MNMKNEVKDGFIRFKGLMFKSVNHNGKKSIVAVRKGFASGKVFYNLVIRKLILKNTFDDYKNFTIVREFKDYYYIENELFFIESSFLTIVDIALNRLNK